MKRKTLSKGFSLIEVLIFFLIVAVAIEGISVFIVTTKKSLLFSSASSVRDELVKEIKSYSTLLSALRNTIIQSQALGTINSEFVSCLDNLGTCVPPTDSLGQPINYPLTLFGPTSPSYGQTQVRPISGPGPVGAPGASPARYTTLGELCPPGAPPSVSCPFEVYTTFQVTCPTPPPAGSPCGTKAQTIQVSYTIQEAPQVIANPSQNTIGVFAAVTDTAPAVNADKIVFPSPIPTPPGAGTSSGSSTGSGGGSSGTPEPTPSPSTPITPSSTGGGTSSGTIGQHCPPGTTPIGGKCVLIGF